MNEERERVLIELILLLAERLYICSQALSRVAEKKEARSK